MGCRKGKSAMNKIYGASHGRVTQEQLVHQADLDQGQDSLTVRDPALIPCYACAKYFLARRKACPLETLKAPDFPCDSCIMCPFPFGNKHLHLVSRATMLSRPLLVYRYVGKQKELWPRPVKRCTFLKCVSPLGKEYKSKESSLKNGFNSFTQTACTSTRGSNYEVSRAKT